VSDAASALVVGALEGVSLTKDEREFCSKEHPAGVTVFKRNISPHYSEFKTLISELQSIRPSNAPPFIVAVDQEGGRVARFKAPFPDFGPAEKLADGRSDDEAVLFIENYGFSVGCTLGAMGVNVNFAPVVDIRTPTTNDAVGDRVFGSDPDAVCRRASAFLRGMQNSGVLGCLKHFPGKGHAATDTHLAGAVIDLTRKELEAREFVPYRRLMPLASMIMVSHAIYPALSSVGASRSPEIIQGLLRKEMGFKGVVVSDDMNMGAVPQDDKSWQDAIVESVVAGADMILVCRHLERCIAAIEALRAAGRRSKIIQTRIEEAAARVFSLRRVFSK
jgi:beta-N-acetylhexosaminidase